MTRSSEESNNPPDPLLRPFAGTQADYEALAQVRNATLRAVTLPADYSDVSAEEMRRYYYRSDFDLNSNAWLLFLDGEAVGAAVVYPRSAFTDRAPGNFDMYIVPQRRRQGLGSLMLAHLAREAVGRGHRVLETTVAGEDSQSTSFLAGHGFAVVGRSLHMVREGMSDLPPVLLPTGYTLRSLHEMAEPPELYMETANRLGAHDPNFTLIRPEELERIASGDGWEPKGVLFLFCAEGRIVGLIRATRAKAGKSRGYLSELRLEPASRGKGLGTALPAAALRYLAEAGVGRTELDVTGENIVAQALASKAGFSPARHWLHFMKAL